MSNFITNDEAIQIYGTSFITVFKTEKIPFVYLNGAYLFKTSDIEKYLNDGYEKAKQDLKDIDILTREYANRLASVIEHISKKFFKERIKKFEIQYDYDQFRNIRLRVTMDGIQGHRIGENDIQKLLELKYSDDDLDIQVMNTLFATEVAVRLINQWKK